MTDTLPAITNEQYHADHSRLSNSMLTVFRDSPQLFYELFVAQTRSKPEPTEAMILGTMVHTAVLEPERWEKSHYVMPKCDRRTKLGKLEWEEALFKAGDRSPISDAQHLLISGIAKAVRSSATAANLISMSGLIEHTVHWDDPDTELAMKARMDKVVLINDSPVILDLKTCQSSSPESFARSCVSYGYYRQAALYSEALEMTMGQRPRFAFIAVSTAQPHEVGVYELDEAAIELGQRHNREARQAILECQQTGIWQAPYQRSIVTLPLPRWVHHNNYE